MKKLFAILSLTLSLCLLAGCMGTPVVYRCDCPTDGQSNTQPDSDNPQTLPAGALKTGLAVVANAGDSKNATAADNGEATYDVTLVAVVVDDKGVIYDCIIDSIGTRLLFDANGAITSDLSAPISTKNELGDDYGMKAYGGAKYEWYEQAAALANYAVGKTVEELKNGAINESGKAADADLASTATIYLGGYVSAIEQAVANAKHLGAQSGDVLKLASLSSFASSVAATTDKEGTAQLDVDVTAITMNGETITSCYIDSLQAKIGFTADGVITADLSAPLLTKNALGENYGMKAWGGATYEWYEQAGSFAQYVTGKTADEVVGIAVNEKTAPTDTDLSATVTIAIGGFQALIGKAAQ